MRIINEIKLAFGLRGDKIIHIDELTEEERGLSCGCVCPSCGATLQAKLGLKNRHHFSHNTKKCSVDVATQTAVHMLAKDIISSAGELLFPSISLEYKKSSSFFYEYIPFVPETIEIQPARYVKCDDILLENKLSSIVPDILLISKDTICIVEIAVTHFVDEIKESKIRNLGIPAIEIDLSKHYKQNFNINELYNDIINNCENRRWIHYPNMCRLIQKADLEYKIKINKIINKEKEAKKEWERQKKEHEKECKQREKIIKEQDEIYYKNKLKQYRSDIKTDAIISNFHFAKDTKNRTLPFFLDIPIDGEIIFMCDRRIWQCALFDKFIYYRNTSKNAIVSINNIFQWVKKHQSLFKLNWSDIYSDFGNAYHIIEQYLTYMHFLGFVSELHRQEAKLLCAHTLIPPKQEHANLLYSAISCIDGCSRNPNKEIEQYLAEAYDVFLSNKKEMEYRIIQSYKNHF